MMLLREIVADRTIYIGLRKHKTDRRVSLASALCEIDIPPTRQNGAFAKIYATFQEIIAPYVDETRLKQLRELAPAGLRAASSEEDEISEAEKKTRKNLAIASISLALTTAGVLFYPVLYLPAAVCILYPLMDIYKNAYPIPCSK